MAGRRQEARLAEIGLLGQHLRLGEFLVDAQEFGVRLATRCSSVSLARFSARSASTRAVMSV